MSCLLRRQKVLFRVKRGFIFSAVSTGGDAVNDSLIANTKGFTGQKYGFKRVQWWKKNLPQHLALYKRLAHLLYTSTRVRTHTPASYTTAILHFGCLNHLRLSR